MARCRPGRALLLVALLVATSLLSLAPAAGAAAATEQGVLPASMVGASAVYHNGASYILGGRLANGQYTDAIYRYDHATGALDAVGKLPRIGTEEGGRQSGAAAVLNSKIYYFGGAHLTRADINGDGQMESIPRAITDIVEVDPTTGATKTTTVRLPKGLFGLGAAPLNGKVYLFGGFSFDVSKPAEIARSDAIYEFDGTRVRSAGTLPSALQDAGIATLNGRIYLFGGLSDHKPDANPCPTYTYYNPDSGKNEERQPTACATDTIFSYNPSTGVATAIAKLPFRGQFLNAGVVNGKAYVSGGALPGPTPTASIVEFDPVVADPVRVLTPTLAKAVYGAPATSDGSIIMLFGGRVGGVSELSAAIQRVDPKPTAPWAPRALAAQPGGAGVRLVWEPPAYDGGSPVTTYRVYRATVDGPDTLLANVTGGAVQYTDTAAQPGVDYVYRVKAVGVAGESETAASVDTRTAETPPGAIDSLEVFTANQELLLRWLPPAQTGGLALSGYRIYRDDMSKPLASIGPNVREFRDTALTNGQKYTYAVSAINSKGAGPLSEPVAQTPAAVPPAPSSSRAENVPGTGVRVTWDTVPTADGYVVLRGTEPKHLAAISRQTSGMYTDESVELGRTYYYAVAAYNAQGESPPTELKRVSLVTKPSAPAQLIVAPGQAEIRLTWQAPTDLGGADPSEIRYFVTRTDAGSANGRIIATDLKGTTYTDKPLQPGRTYAYTITALNPLEGTPTDAKSATVKDIVNAKPKAVLAALPPIAKANENIELDASQSSDSDGKLVTYRFDFGDGTPAVVTDKSSVTHAYRLNGTYYPTVSVIDNRNDESDPAIIQVVIGQISAPPTEDTTGLGIGGRGDTSGQSADARPGTKSPTPAPGALLALAMLGVAAFVMRRRR